MVSLERALSTEPSGRITKPPVTKSVEPTANALRKFYDAAPTLPLPPKPPTWNEIGRQLKTIYERALNQ